MIREEDTRTVALLGEDALEKLKKARVAVFGLGGVGGSLCEALVRAGVGQIDIFDGDVVTLSNINRQVIALHSNVGKAKVDVARERILDINPDCAVRAHNVFYLPENAADHSFEGYNYIADAVDTVAAKIEIIVRADAVGVPVISAMGAGNKLDATAFEIADIYDTQVCPLAKVMRKELKQRGVKRVKTVYSKEPAIKNDQGVIGSVSFVPTVMGLIMAGEIIKDITKSN